MSRVCLSISFVPPMCVCLIPPFRMRTCTRWIILCYEKMDYLFSLKKRSCIDGILERTKMASQNKIMKGWQTKYVKHLVWWVLAHDKYHICLTYQEFPQHLWEGRTILVGVSTTCETIFNYTIPRFSARCYTYYTMYARSYSPLLCVSKYVLYYAVV